MQRAIPVIASYFNKLLFRTRDTERLVETLTLSGLYKLSRYDGTLPYHERAVRALLWEVKYYASNRAVILAGEYLAELLLAEASDCVGIPLLIPMPMHAKRRRERGHNQTEVLCKAALVHLGEEKTEQKKVWKPLGFISRGRPEDFFVNSFFYAPNILRRTRHTKPQQGLERHDRLKNLKNSMEVSDTSKIKGRICIVVDDVSTTGASFAEAKRALKAAGASEVRTVALAQS